MSNEITIPTTSVSKYSDDEFKKLSTSGNFLPRFQLYGANSDAVKEGKMPMAHYGLATSKDTIEDLGEAIEYVAIAWRPKALDISEDEILNVFDPNDPTFKDIADRSETKDSGCMYGPEFLIWLPKKKLFATFFCNSKTSRREAPAIKGMIGQLATIKAKFIKTEKYSWHGPIVMICSTPMENAPSPELVAEVVERFNNPPKQEVEKAEPVAGGRER